MQMAEQGAEAMFEQEWRTYREHKEHLLATAPGNYVVIRGNVILGTYPDTALAFAAGVAAYGPERFFLHRIAETEPEAYSPPPFIGMVVAGSPLRYPAP
jgi:hypothetical protein